MPLARVRKPHQTERTIHHRQPGGPTTHHRKTHRPSTKQVHLEDILTELVRFEGRLYARLEHAFQALEQGKDPHIRHIAMSRRLSYVTTALDIAVGPNPELNLFDMIAFLEISRHALNSHWIPTVFGPAGTPVAEAFDASLAWITKFLENVISEEQREELSSFIAQWIEEHPEHYAAETFRLSAFSESFRKPSVSSEGRGISQLIQHAHRALSTADTMRLVAERAFYYAQRAPFLMRLQARVGMYELLGDGFHILRMKENKVSLLKAPLLLLGERSPLSEIRKKWKKRRTHPEPRN